MRSSRARAATAARDAGLLFTYGTLMRGFPLHRLLEGRAEYLGEGRAAARIIDLGSYPGAVPDAAGALRGEIYRVLDPALWPALDSAEGPQYHRREIPVRSEDGRELAASIYWYVGPLGRGVPIPGGDYRAHAPATAIHHPQSP
ncbi:MAG TPA: gamma-glutamylcyclotransferase family protein [Methylomirabilota bacterium]